MWPLGPAVPRAWSRGHKTLGVLSLGCDTVSLEQGVQAVLRRCWPLSWARLAGKDPKIWLKSRKRVFPR